MWLAQVLDNCVCASANLCDYTLCGLSNTSGINTCLNGVKLFPPICCHYAGNSH